LKKRSKQKNPKSKNKKQTYWEEVKEEGSRFVVVVATAEGELLRFNHWILTQFE
jgi:hypothetical protein